MKPDYSLGTAAVTIALFIFVLVVAGSLIGVLNDVGSAFSLIPR